VTLQDAPNRKIIRHAPFVFRILRFRSEGAVMDWKLDAVGPPGAPPEKRAGKGGSA
jgi:hypothetical protein